MGQVDMGVETKCYPEWRMKIQQAPAKEIADFAKSYPHEYMRKCLEQYPYWGNKDNGFERQNI